LPRHVSGIALERVRPPRTGKSRLTVRAAAQSSQHAKVAQNQHIQVHRLIIPHQMSAASAVCRVAFDAQDRVWLIFGARRVLDYHEASFGVVMHDHLLRPASAPDAEIPERRLLAGQCLLMGYAIPLATLRVDGVHELLPDHGPKDDGSFQIEMVFVLLRFFRESGGQIFLCSSLRARFVHGPSSPSLFYTTIIQPIKEHLSPAPIRFMVIRSPDSWLLRTCNWRLGRDPSQCAWYPLVRLPPGDLPLWGGV